MHRTKLENENADAANAAARIRSVCMDCTWLGAWRTRHHLADEDGRKHAELNAPAPVDPAKCAHEEFRSYLGVGRMVDEAGQLTGFHASVGITCVQCGTEFVFLGVPQGMSLDVPAVSIDGSELRVPIAPSFAWQGPGAVPNVRGFMVSRIDMGDSDA
jgi:hypothetical protein